MSKKKILKEIYKDPERKSLSKIFKELITLLIINKEIPTYYFQRYLFKQDRTNFKDFVSNSESTKTRFLNTEGSTMTVQNKLFFELFYKYYGINTPKILMYNYNNIFTYKGKAKKISISSDLVSLLNTLFKDYSTEDAIIIKKTYESYGGKSIYKFFKKDIHDYDKIEQLYKNVINSAFIYQMVVKQHKDLNRLNPSCLNTVRIDTFYDKNGTLELLSAYLRMSYSNSYVDNIGSGGCMVGIDLKSGTLKKNGYKTINKGVDYLSHHPITKVKFENYQLPFFEETKKMVLKTASLVPELKSVGWDIGFSETGPVLIEGNSNYNAAGNDLTYGGYKSHPVFQKVLKELKEQDN